MARIHVGCKKRKKERKCVSALQECFLGIMVNDGFNFGGGVGGDD